MKVLRSIIVEDEILAIELLLNYIEKVDFLEVVATTRNPMNVSQLLEKHEAEVLFLDINMPMLNGIELYKSLVNPPQVIFTTSYPNYAVEGFNLEAIDYLLKPIAFPRFLKACHRLIKQQRTDLKHDTNSAKSTTPSFVYLKSGAVTHKVNWQDVLYLEKDENYTIYHTKDKRILVRQTLAKATYLFPKYICRIHKSYAVSLLHIEQLWRDAIKVAGKKLPISRHFRESFTTLFQEYSGS